MSNTLLTLFDIDRYHEYYRAGFWRDDTIYDLVRMHAEQTPERVALRSGDATLTYRTLLMHVDAFASDLASRGMIIGQRVAVWLPSRPETVIALLACSRNGYVCCPSLHRDHTVDDIIGLLYRMHASAIIAEGGYGADAKKKDLFARASEIQTIRHVYRLEKNSREPGVVTVLQAQAPTPLTTRNANRVLYLAFTSGTTGIPKGVMHSDNTLLANARALSSDWNITNQSVIYSLSPLSHNLGFGAMIMALAVGGEFVIHDLPRGKSLVDRLIETESTFLVGVPTHAIDLLAELKARNLPGLGKLHGFRISGASAPPGLIEQLLKFGIVPQSGYGMTETCSHQYTRARRRPEADCRELRESLPWLRDPHLRPHEIPNRELPPREIGQIGGRGASLMLGYFDDQTGYRRFLQPRWLVHDRRPRLDRREWLPARHRPQEGRDYSWGS